MVYQTEKTLNELGDKITEEEKAGITAEVEKLKETLKGTDTEAIKAQTEELTKKFYEISEKLYKQAQEAQAAAGAADAGAAGASDDNVVDADFTQVD